MNLFTFGAGGIMVTDHELFVIKKNIIITIMSGVRHVYISTPEKGSDINVVRIVRKKIMLCCMLHDIKKFL